LFVCLIFFVFVYLIVLLVVFGIYCIQTNSHFFDLIIYLVEVVYRSFVVLMWSPIYFQVWVIEGPLVAVWFMIYYCFKYDHRPTISHWQTLSNDVVSSTPHLSVIRTHSVSGDKQWLHR
jgi:hypothetical protein